MTYLDAIAVGVWILVALVWGAIGYLVGREIGRRTRATRPDGRHIRRHRTFTPTPPADLPAAPDPTSAEGWTDTRAVLSEILPDVWAIPARRR